MALQIGDEAPDFTLTDHTGEAITLSALRGSPVVLVFYPAAFTGRCTGELCAIRDELSAFEGAEAKVYGVSTDTAASLRVFHEQEGLTFDLLSDFWPHGAVAQAYDAFLPERGQATRATYVIDRDGRIAAHFRVSPAESRDMDAYREALAGLA
ncbi:peroxiredoxin [Agrococcus carbonis]|uniref:thioredoxin-dependent peroxiredoxin n=1 Tax=Agrococcus carbonis TaxID=684552 RepID=A0A1H1L0F3_9MICO|nr:peroxiredoxin [Agrococcus carbonis]SDR68051.1 Peroxiredoxin [Agrococcus carbonis]